MRKKYNYSYAIFPKKWKLYKQPRKAILWYDKVSGNDKVIINPKWWQKTWLWKKFY